MELEEVDKGVETTEEEYRWFYEGRNGKDQTSILLILQINLIIVYQDGGSTIRGRVRSWKLLTKRERDPASC